MKIVNLSTGSGGTIPVRLRKHHWARRVTLKVHASEVRVTLPKRVPYKVGEEFARRQQSWINTQLAHRKQKVLEPPTRAQREAARQVITNRVEYWSQVMNQPYGKISIRNQRTRWGSCSSVNNLNFNWRLSNLDQDLIDYVVVHELTHISHRNHSSEFYRALEGAMPRYKYYQTALNKLSLQEAHL